MARVPNLSMTPNLHLRPLYKGKELDGGIQPPTQLDKVGIYALVLEVMTPQCKGLRLGIANPIPIFYFIPFFFQAFFE